MDLVFFSCWPDDKLHDNHKTRTVEVGRDLCGLSSPTLLLKARSPTAGCPGLCPVRLQVSPKMKTPKPLPVFNHPHSRKVGFFVQTKFPVFQFLPVACSVTCLLCTSYQVFINVAKVLLSPLFLRLNSPSSLSIPLYVRCSMPYTVNN